MIDQKSIADDIEAGVETEACYMQNPATLARRVRAELESSYFFIPKDRVPEVTEWDKPSPVSFDRPKIPYYKATNDTINHVIRRDRPTAQLEAQTLANFAILQELYVRDESAQSEKLWQTRREVWSQVAPRTPFSVADFYNVKTPLATAVTEIIELRERLAETTKN